MIAFCFVFISFRFIRALISMSKCSVLIIEYVPLKSSLTSNNETLFIYIFGLFRDLNEVKHKTKQTNKKQRFVYAMRRWTLLLSQCIFNKKKHVEITTATRLVFNIALCPGSVFPFAPAEIQPKFIHCHWWRSPRENNNKEIKNRLRELWGHHTILIYPIRFSLTWFGCLILGISSYAHLDRDAFGCRPKWCSIYFVFLFLIRLICLQWVEEMYFNKFTEATDEWTVELCGRHIKRWRHMIWFHFLLTSICCVSVLLPLWFASRLIDLVQNDLKFVEFS